MLGAFSELLSHFTFSSVLDILLVALVFYALFYFVQGTRAVQLLRGTIIVIFLAFLAGSLFHLTAFNWLVRNSIPALLVAIPVIFQPELRRALERLGRPGSLLARKSATTAQMVSTIARAASEKLGLVRLNAPDALIAARRVAPVTAIA